MEYGISFGTCEVGRGVPRDAGESTVCPEDERVKAARETRRKDYKFYGGQWWCSANSMKVFTRVTAFSAWSRGREPFF